MRPSGVPTVVERSASGEQAFDIYSRLLRERVVFLGSELNDELPTVASLAKAYCSDAYLHCAAENIQIHGGIGFTWEHPAHLYLKRAKSSSLALGTADRHRASLTGLADLPAASA